MVVNDGRELIAQAQSALPESQAYYSEQGKIIGYAQSPRDWWQVFEQVIFKLGKEMQSRNLTLETISHLAIDGTSGTVLFTDASGTPCTQALMYNDQRSVAQAKRIEAIAPENTAVSGSTSGLAKLLWLYEQSQSPATIHHALNQADWISGRLAGHYGFSDHNNALKMGYDAEHHCWPDWLTDFLESQPFPVSALPRVFTPGEVVDVIDTEMRHHFGFHPDLKICAGTTDSTAAIIASGAREEGEGITSLGSSLVMKVITRKPVFARYFGVYSQPYGQLWLVGGSSNSGGSVLKSFFCPGELSEHTQALSEKISQGSFHPLELDYYPLLSPGERFPVADETLESKLSPRPDKDVDFFQALLEGMADIERIAYQRLLELGAPYPKRVTSVGGGAFNQAWRYIREQKLGVPVLLAKQEQAAFGTALLAQTSWNQ